MGCVCWRVSISFPMLILGYPPMFFTTHKLQYKLCEEFWGEIPCNVASVWKAAEDPSRHCRVPAPVADCVHIGWQLPSPLSFVPLPSIGIAWKTRTSVFDFALYGFWRCSGELFVNHLICSMPCVPVVPECRVIESVFQFLLIGPDICPPKAFEKPKPSAEEWYIDETAEGNSASLMVVWMPSGRETNGSLQRGWPVKHGTSGVHATVTDVVHHFASNCPNSNFPPKKKRPAPPMQTLPFMNMRVVCRWRFFG